MTRYYVTMTWDDWPKGGSCGDLIEAEDHRRAKDMCLNMMADSLADSDDDADHDAKYYLDKYSGNWNVVDCFDFDAFVANHPHPDNSQFSMAAALDSITVIDKDGNKRLPDAITLRRTGADDCWDITARWTDG